MPNEDENEKTEELTDDMKKLLTIWDIAVIISDIINNAENPYIDRGYIQIQRVLVKTDQNHIITSSIIRESPFDWLCYNSGKLNFLKLFRICLI